jgi:O-antigen/teichoic acid export membrane protein
VTDVGRPEEPSNPDRSLASRVRGRLPSWTGQWLRDARLLISAQLVAMVATIALAIVLARSLGPSDWGLFSALLGVSLALSTFVELGIGTWLLRGLSALRSDERVADEEYRQESARRLAGAFAANGILGMLLLAGTAAVAFALKTDGSTLLGLIGLLAYTIFLITSNCLETHFRAERRLTWVVAAVVTEKALLLALVVLVVVLGGDIWVLGVVYAISGAARLGFVSVVVYLRDRLPLVVPGSDDIRAVALGGVPFAVNTVTLNVIPRFDTLIVATVSATAAGYFALGDRIVGPAMIIPVVASAALYPFLSREHPGSRAGWKIAGGMLGFGLVAAVVGAILAPFVIPFVFGDAYDDAVRVVQLMLFVLPFIYANNPLLAHVYARGEERRVLVLTAVSALLGTGLILFGQIVVGPEGAACGYVIRQALFTASLSVVAVMSHRKGGGSWETFEPPSDAVFDE